MDGGYREGKNNRAINRPEADAVVEKIVEFELTGEEKAALNESVAAVQNQMAATGL